MERPFLIILVTFLLSLTLGIVAFAVYPPKVDLYESSDAFTIGKHPAVVWGNDRHWSCFRCRASSRYSGPILARVLNSYVCAAGGASNGRFLLQHGVSLQQRCPVRSVCSPLTALRNPPGRRCTAADPAAHCIQVQEWAGRTHQGEPRECAPPGAVDRQPPDLSEAVHALRVSVPAADVSRSLLLPVSRV